LTIGDVIRNEKVTPSGIPASTKPINKGTEEQEQKGVTIPNRDAMKFPPIPLKFPKIFFVLSGGK
jgi:hypothetical protein